MALDPSNDKLVIALERLLERRERWDELIGLWRDQIPKLSTEDAPRDARQGRGDLTGEVERA